MSSLFTAFWYKMLLLFISFTSLFGVMSGPATDDIIVVNEEAKMTAVLWGDPQVADYMADRHQYTKNAAIDLSNAEGTFDALVFAGDITENGKGPEYQLVLDYLAVAKKKIDHHIFTVGNHDVRLRAYSQAVNTFSEFCLAADEKLDIKALAYKEGKLSYSYEVNGYTFIALGTDKSVFEESYFSDECLAWFDAELAKATADGKPVFVLLHQPLKNTHNVEVAWNSPGNKGGTVGKQSDALKNIMDKYQNVFFITGHLHLGFSHQWSIYNLTDNIVGINLPGIGPDNADGDNNDSGTGYIMEVYDDEVVFKARNFATGKYLPEFDVLVKLK